MTVRRTRRPASVKVSSTRASAKRVGSHDREGRRQPGEADVPGRRARAADQVSRRLQRCRRQAGGCARSCRPVRRGGAGRGSNRTSCGAAPSVAAQCDEHGANRQARDWKRSRTFKRKCREEAGGDDDGNVGHAGREEDLRTARRCAAVAERLVDPLGDCSATSRIGAEACASIGAPDAVPGIVRKNGHVSNARTLDTRRILERSSSQTRRKLRPAARD